VSFVHPLQGSLLEVLAPLPADLASVLQALAQTAPA
jgi:hypothetical protein